ncbi:MAG: porin [Geminicoccaceae bacterium]
MSIAAKFRLGGLALALCLLATPVVAMEDFSLGGLLLERETVPALSDTATRSSMPMSFTPRGQGTSIWLSGASAQPHSTAALMPAGDTKAGSVGLGVDTHALGDTPVHLSFGGSINDSRDRLIGGREELAVQGEVGIANFKVGAAFLQDEDATSVDKLWRASLAYAIGPVTTRVAYDRLDQGEVAGIYGLGADLALGSSLTLQGDLALRDPLERDSSAAGLVSIRLSF